MGNNKTYDTDSKSFFENGILSSIIRADRYFYIYKTLGLNVNYLENKATPVEKNTLAFIQSSSHDLAVISLYKVFERNTTSHNFHTLLKKLKKLDDQPIKDADEYNELSYLFKIIDFTYSPDKEYSTSKLIKQIHLILNQYENEIGNLKNARNNFVAHSGKNTSISKLNTFWADYVELLKLARLLGYIIGNQFIGESYSNLNYFEEEFTFPTEVQN